MVPADVGASLLFFHASALSLFLVPPLTRRRLREIASLARKRTRDDLGQCLVEGVRSVEAAVLAGAPLLEVLVTEEAAEGPRVAEVLARFGGAVHIVAAHELERVAETQTAQGLVAVARIERAAPEDLAGAVVALDGVQDPGNVGAIVRTAAWFGASAVLAGPGTADPFGPKAVRAAMGGLWELDLAATDDLAASLAQLRARGLPIHGADLEGEPARSWAPPREAVLVLGSEAHGLSEEVGRLLEGRVRIAPPEGAAPRRGVESLNVAVAAGVLLHRWLG